MVNNMWALIIGNEVREVTDIDPVGRFHESLLWVPCGGQINPGWLFESGVFSAPVVSADGLAAVERTWRDNQLSSTEWLVTRHRDELDMQSPTTLQAAQFAVLLQYRQALRDWPQSEQFPVIEHRPVAPLWIAEQNQ